MSETEAKLKRFAIKILEKDFDELTAFQEKWSKQKGVEFTMDEVVDYIMQTGIVRAHALEKYAKKQKVARKEAAKSRPVKAKKVKEPKAKKAGTRKKKAAASAPSEPEASPESAPAAESAPAGE